MSDTQFYVLVTVLGTGLATIGGAIRWSVNRMVKALEVNSAAMLENTKSNTVLSTKVDSIFAWMERRGTIPPETRHNTGNISIVKKEE